MKKTLIIGAGPAGLAAAYELVKNSDIKPYVVEMTGQIGGISKTVNHDGYRMDMGGHRFFTKSKRVMDFWLDILPKAQNDADAEEKDDVMLQRSRLSRILYLNKFFDYPISLSYKTLKNLGFVRTMKIGFSYLRYAIAPIKDEKTLEQFFTNRFGKELYETFFKDYTEKVWGVLCNEIPADWGAQRVKGVSITAVIKDALKRIFKIKSKEVETSLISSFLYPKYGPGQLWEKCAEIIKREGGTVAINRRVIRFNVEGYKVVSAVVKNERTGKLEHVEVENVLSSMPVNELISSMGDAVPNSVQEVAKKLPYRDFITVGLVLKKVLLKDEKGTLKDNWIYVQENFVKVGRLQIFNNWSPYMSKDGNIFIGMEYFCNEGDELWEMTDEQMARFAIDEMVSLNIIDEEDVISTKVVHVPKAYPAYFGSYNRFQEIADFTDSIDNLYLIGRNGMHRYNNSDHSSLSAMYAVDVILGKETDKKGIWEVNTEKEYHEK